MESLNRRTIKKGRTNRNKKIRDLRELVCTFFVQFLFSAPSGEVPIDTPPKREGRSWSSQPPVPPSSPILGEPENLYLYETARPQTPPPFNSSTESTELESEEFRPISPSYTPVPSFVPEQHFPDPIPSPAPSVKFLGEQEEPRVIIDPLLELLRRTCTPWTDPVPERAYTVGPDHFNIDEIRRQASQSPPDTRFFIYYYRVETPFLAPVSLIDLAFPRSSVKLTEIIDINLD
ncbi:hypothetical protein PUN28_009759 [Cardiocondyla obscurior]|uniref:Uncharacterized protein n=1 Tax=Cardiocondyla obscurior TaxID=286306 RepID=A0AAW2FMQ4_9HYME